MTTKKSVSYFAFGIIPQSVLPNFFHFHRFIKVDASIDAANSAHFTNYISATIFHYIYKISTILYTTLNQKNFLIFISVFGDLAFVSLLYNRRFLRF